jgi:hypothetical protein
VVNVGTPSEWGKRGYETTLARYGEYRMNQWRRRGGRKPNPTLAQLEAMSRPIVRTGKKKAGATPPATNLD